MLRSAVAAASTTAAASLMGSRQGSRRNLPSELPQPYTTATLGIQDLASGQRGGQRNGGHRGRSGCAGSEGGRAASAAEWERQLQVMAGGLRVLVPLASLREAPAAPY